MLLMNDTKSDKPGKESTIKIFSFELLLWLLKNYENIFTQVYDVFLGDNYRDCLILAKIAKCLDMDKGKINLLLMPMASALLNDEDKIISGRYLGGNGECLLSSASKWAPRHGKSFAEFIHPLRKLCGIKGRNIDIKWRKFIRGISETRKADNSI